MKKNLLLLLAIGNTIFFSCQKKKSDSNSDFVNYNSIPDSITNMNKSMINIDLIKEHIELQKNIDSDEIEHENPYDLTLEDLKIEDEIIRVGLNQNGFKNIDNYDFYEKLEKIFNINLKNNNCLSIKNDKDYIVLFGDLMDGKLETIEYNKYDMFYYTNNLFISKKNKLIFQVDILANLIQIDSNNSYKIRLPQYMISRNKYLFNDDKSQFAWLINNDSFFMENLVTNFGYTEDKKLLNWVMEKNKSNAVEFVKNNIFVKNCQGDLEIREGILKYIEENTNENDNTYYTALESFGYKIGDDNNFNKNEKVKIIAYIANSLSPLFYKYTQLNGNAIWNSATMLYNLSVRNEYIISEIEKNNYFNLSNLKEVIENLDVEAPPLPAE